MEYYEKKIPGSIQIYLTILQYFYYYYYFELTKGIYILVQQMRHFVMLIFFYD